MKKRPFSLRYLGHYEILEPLGKGGVGEVYRAGDTKVDRDVAIKVLPEDFATDVDRLARFEREAKLLASLNHTNIAASMGWRMRTISGSSRWSWWGGKRSLSGLPARGASRSRKPSRSRRSPVFTGDVAPSGDRFLMIKPPSSPPPTGLQVVLNWFEDFVMT